MEVDEAADWRGCQGFEGLETLEESLRCDICKEFLDAPVSVAGCGHSFCSLCIRASLEFQQRAGSPRCPTCRGDASTATLRVNPQLRAAVDSFEKLRGSLLRKLSAGGSSSSGDPQEPESRGVVTRASKSSLRQVVNTERQEVLPKGKTRCPICGVLLSTALAQAHVSYCLEKQERKESGAGAGVRPGAAGVSAGFFTMSGSKRPRSSGAPPKKLPKLVYHILKDRELKSYLQKYHLPTTGDRQEQTSRLKQFTHHYNAAADSGKQVSTKSIAGVVLKEERERKRAERKRASLESHGAEAKGAEEERFSRMIEDVRRRRSNQVAEQPEGAVVDLVADEGDGAGKAEEPSFGFAGAGEVEIEDSEEVEDSEDNDDDFVIPSQMHPRRRSTRISSQG